MIYFTISMLIYMLFYTARFNKLSLSHLYSSSVQCHQDAGTIQVSSVFRTPVQLKCLQDNGTAQMSLGHRYSSSVYCLQDTGTTKMQLLQLV